jgi:SlyX protein
MIMEHDAEERIIALETKLAYMEDFINQLQAVTVEHTETIELLRKENRLLSQKVRDMAEQLEGDIPNRKPPHY